MNELILINRPKLITIRGYGGVCHNCNSPVSYSGEMRGICFEETEESFRLLLFDFLKCPHCGDDMKTVKVYRSLDVTQELKKDLVNE